jgi:hypothetical protein
MNFNHQPVHIPENDFALVEVLKELNSNPEAQRSLSDNFT